MNEQLIRQFLDKRNVFVVVGASRDPKKYGHQVFKDLRNAGYRVHCVNPNAKSVLGAKCYPDIEALPEKPDVADIVVPPKTTEQVVKSCCKLGIMKVWMQPGSESEEALRFCSENGMEVVHGVCVIVERRTRQE